MTFLPARVRQERVKRHSGGLLPTRNRRLRRRAHSRGARSLLRRFASGFRAALRPCLFALVAAGSAAGAVALVRFALASPRFRVREVRVEGTGRARPDELRGRLRIDPEANIFRVELAEIVRDTESDPWVREAHAHRELPGTIVVDVTEHVPRIAVLLGHLYLADAEGHVFKRASADEAAGLPVVTGLDRLELIADREAGERRLRDAVALVDAYAKEGRPALGEVHLEPAGTPTLYTRDGAVQIRLGEGALDKRLARLDVVWGALGPEAERVRAIYLDSPTREDRVTVRLATTE
ncbi:MAG: FtsQ-type POTRA domain-containing protein [Myxococcota bacterium]